MLNFMIEDLPLTPQTSPCYLHMFSVFMTFLRSKFREIIRRLARGFSGCSVLYLVLVYFRYRGYYEAPYIKLNGSLIRNPKAYEFRAEHWHIIASKLFFVIVFEVINFTSQFLLLWSRDLYCCIVVSPFYHFGSILQLSLSSVVPYLVDTCVACRQ